MYERSYGYLYNRKLDTAEIAKLIRKDIKTAISEGLLPDRWTYSVRIDRRLERLISMSRTAPMLGCCAPDTGSAHTCEIDRLFSSAASSVLNSHPILAIPLDIARQIRFT